MLQTQRIFMSWLVIISLIGCTSMKPVTHKDTQQAVQFKDRVIIYERSGRIIDMKVVSLDEHQITGSLTNAPLTSISIPFDDIEKLEVESIDGAKTTLAVLGGVLLLPFFVLGVALGVADSVDSQ